MENSQMSYRFTHVVKCNMCGSFSDQHQRLGKRLNKPQGKNPKKKIGITTTIVRCNTCGLIYSNPQPFPIDIQNHYGVVPESYWKESYFQVAENYFSDEIQKAKNFIAFKAGMKSLDIGAGIGKAMIALTRAGFDAYGFEPSEQFHERAIKTMGIDASKLKLGMIEDVDYPSSHFDFISFGAVLEHLQNPSDAILKAFGWLKPHGVIHIEVPSSNWLIHKLINLFYTLRLSDHVANLSPMHEPYHLYEFGLKSFQEHGRLNQYKVVFHEYYVCETYLPRLFDYVLKPYMVKTKTGMQLCVWLRKT